MVALCLAILAWVIVSACIAWGVLALWFDSSRNRGLAGLLAIAFVIGCATLLAMIRPMWRALLCILALLLLLLVWWTLIPPRNDRDWQPDVARLARAKIQGTRLIIDNVRNFDYHSAEDYTEHWETRTYDLDQLQGADMFFCFWGPTLIAHTIVSWQFANGAPLAISIETRKEKGESYSAVRGFFRQFELYYVVSDERDVIRLRTNFRGEKVFLYRLRMDAQDARAVLLDYLEEVNRLSERPRWYNAVTHNCTTSIRHHAVHVGKGNPWDWRILANGYADQLGYERGTIDTSLPFPDLKKRSEITAKAIEAGDSPDFSVRIREGLPGKSGTDDE